MLSWDSEFWGFPVGRVRGSTLDEERADRIDAWCEAQKVVCLYLLADAADGATRRVATERGYRFVDLRITLERASAPERMQRQSPEVAIRRALGSDLDVLRDLATRSHTQTRFFSDGRFPPARREELYATWVGNDLSDPDVEVLVAIAGGEGGTVSGYVTFRTGPGPEIRLIAVESKLRDRGVGAALLTAALRSIGPDRAVRVVTQGENASALRLYERCGFAVESTGAWYHRWYR